MSSFLTITNLPKDSTVGSVVIKGNSSVVFLGAAFAAGLLSTTGSSFLALVVFLGNLSLPTTAGLSAGAFFLGFVPVFSSISLAISLAVFLVVLDFFLELFIRLQAR